MVQVEIQGAVGFVAGRESFEDLYRRHAPEARHLAYLLTGNKENADDLTQDAFIRAYARLAHLRKQNSFGPYLRKTLVNLAKMQFRRKDTERRYLLRHRNESATMMDEVLSGDDELQGALARLPYRQRAAVVLRFYSDLPDEETAEILGCSPGTVRSLISRGVAALREQMGAPRIG